MMVTFDGFTNLKPKMNNISYRDDIYIVWSGGAEALDCFFWQLSYRHPRIEFTLKQEKVGVLPFLDLSVKR